MISQECWKAQGRRDLVRLIDAQPDNDEQKIIPGHQSRDALRRSEKSEREGGRNRGQRGVTVRGRREGEKDREQ